MGSDPIPLAAFGRRDWPSGQPVSLMCIKRGRFYVLSAHWQYLTEAKLAGVTVVGEEEALEIFPDPVSAPDPNKPKKDKPHADPPHSPRGTLISILRRGSRRGKPRQEKVDGPKGK